MRFGLNWVLPINILYIMNEFNATLKLMTQPLNIAVTFYIKHRMNPTDFSVSTTIKLDIHFWKKQSKCGDALTFHLVTSKSDKHGKHYTSIVMVLLVSSHYHLAQSISVPMNSLTELLMFLQTCSLFAPCLCNEQWINVTSKSSFNCFMCYGA